MPIKVLLADDSDVVRRAIRWLLEQNPEIELVGEAADFSQTVQMANGLKPQVVVMDLHIKDDELFTSIDARSHLIACASQIVAISFSNDEGSKELAESLGAVTLLDKMNLSEDLIPTIEKFARPSASIPKLRE
jgi:DNA-binding NarL/FixJ family response regulator